MRLRKKAVRRLGLVGAALSPIVLAVPVQAAPGDVVTGFGGDGIVDLRAAPNVRRTFAVQDDGKVLTVVTEGDRPVLVRLLANGRLDRTFSSDGKVPLATAEQAVQVAGLTTDGQRAVVVMHEQTAPGTAVIVVGRLTSAGRWDTSFGGDGLTVIDLPGQVSYVGGIDVDADGRTVVVATHTSSKVATLVTRLKPDGTLDRRFSGDGTATVPVPTGSTAAPSSIDTAPDGSIVVGSADISQTKVQTSIARLKPSGDPLRSFGDGGHAEFANGTNMYTEAFDVAFDAQGRIVAAGTTSPTGQGRFRMFTFRMTATGDLDTTFSGDGSRVIDVGPVSVVGGSLARQADGRLVIVGAVNAGTDLIVARVTQRGRMDRTFGVAGVASVRFAPETVGASGIAVSPDGRRIYATAAAGTAPPGTARVVALRVS